MRSSLSRSRVVSRLTPQSGFSSALTEMRAVRSWVKPAQIQLSTALARSSPVGEQRQVDGAPGEEGHAALHRVPAALHHRGAASDRRHRALVVVGERLRVLALDEPGDVLAGAARRTGARPSPAAAAPRFVFASVIRRCRRRRTPPDGRRGSGPARPGRGRRARARRRATRRSGCACRPAPQTSVCAVDHLARTSASRGSARPTATASPTMDLDAALLERRLRVRRGCPS